MASGDSTDLIMKFVKFSSPKAIAGASTTQLVSAEAKNELLNGFDPGHYMEVDRFTLKAGIRDDDDDNKPPAPPPPPPPPPTPGWVRVGKGRWEQRTVPARTPGTVQTPRPTQSLEQTSKRGGFQSWRTGKAHAYPVDMQPITFTRSIDKTSAELIKACIASESFKSATLIKRKSSGIQSATGDVASGEVFLRLDFFGVLITKVDWDNDDQVNESIEFICRSVQITYRPQLPDGSLGRSRQGFWSMAPDERPRPLT